MNTPKPELKQNTAPGNQAANGQKEAPEPVKEKPVIPPESETALAELALPLGDTVLKLQGDNDLLMYGILRRSRAVTRQSDYFRVQFRGFAMNSGGSWNPFPEEEMRFHASRNCVWGRVDHPSRSITFGPQAGMAVFDRFAGLGLDDFLFAQVVSWARHSYPDYRVSPGMVPLVPGTPEAERLRKQAFYAKQGFEFEWSEDGRSGMYFKDRTSRLIGVSDSPRIAEFGGEDMLQTLIKQDEERHALEARLNKVQALNNTVHQALQKERHTAQSLMVALGVFILIALWAIL